MARKHILRKISGAVAVGVLAAAAIVPVQAAVEAARANSYTYNRGYMEQVGTQKRAITQGGSAYDDRGYGVSARLVAGLQIPGDSNRYFAYKHFSGSTSESAVTEYKNNVSYGIHGCEAD